MNEIVIRPLILKTLELLPFTWAALQVVQVCFYLLFGLKAHAELIASRSSWTLKEADIESV